MCECAKSRPARTWHSYSVCAKPAVSTAQRCLSGPRSTSVDSVKLLGQNTLKLIRDKARQTLRGWDPRPRACVSQGGYIRKGCFGKISLLLDFAPLYLSGLTAKPPLFTSVASSKLACSIERCLPRRLSDRQSSTAVYVAVKEWPACTIPKSCASKSRQQLASFASGESGSVTPNCAFCWRFRLPCFIPDTPNVRPPLRIAQCAKHVHKA